MKKSNEKSNYYEIYKRIDENAILFKSCDNPKLQNKYLYNIIHEYKHFFDINLNNYKYDYENKSVDWDNIESKFYYYIWKTLLSWNPSKGTKFTTYYFPYTHRTKKDVYDEYKSNLMKNKIENHYVELINIQKTQETQSDKYICTYFSELVEELKKIDSLTRINIKRDLNLIINTGEVTNKIYDVFNMCKCIVLNSPLKYYPIFFQYYFRERTNDYTKNGINTKDIRDDKFEKIKIISPKILKLWKKLEVIQNQIENYK